MDRRQRILTGINLNNQVGLEIGPLNSPLISKSESQVQYVDHCTTAELRQKYHGQIDAQSLVDVDFVWNGQELRDVVGGKLFDYVVASHVIEHVPDPIRWLQQIHAVLRPNGVLCLAVPDRRFTFDYLRQISTAGELLDAHFRNAKVPSVKQIYDNYTTAVHLDMAAAWQTPPEPASLKKLHPPGFARHFVERVLQGEYIDCHCWIFTPDTFISTMREVAWERLLEFKVMHFYKTQHNELEFIVILEKADLHRDPEKISLEIVSSFDKIRDMKPS